MYYALNYSHLLKATNYDIMYTSIGFMPRFLYVLAVSNGTSSMSTGFRRYGHTELPMCAHPNQLIGSQFQI